MRPAFPMQSGDRAPLARTLRNAAARRAQAGVGYIGIVLVIALFSIGLAALGELWSTQAQREREAELLRIGREFRLAIAGYIANSRAGAPIYPARLEDLLEDRRTPVLRRHLRKLYVDPMTGSDDWGLITGNDGRIRGVFSKSQRAPLKNALFDAADENFQKATAYTDWHFEVEVRGASPRR